MIKIAFANIKGGVAKTTDTAMLGASLKKRGYKVLLVDADPQGTLTERAGLIPESIRDNANGLKHQLLDVFEGTVQLKDAIIPTEMGDIVPNSLDMFVADKRFTGPASYYLLKNALVQVENDYDFALIDVLPGAGIMLFNCLVAADFVTIPIFASKSSVRGIKLLKDCMDEVKSSKLNENLKVLGFIVNRFNKQAKFSNQIIDDINKIVVPLLGAQLFETKIRNGIALDECEYRGRSIFFHKPESNVANDFTKLTEEFLERLDKVLDGGLKTN